MKLSLFSFKIVLASIMISILTFAGDCASAADVKVVKISGAPGAVRFIEAKQTKLEQELGAKLEFIVQSPYAALAALNKGLLDGVAFGGPAVDFFSRPEAQKAGNPRAGDYEALKYGETTIMVVLNPLNPLEKLSHQQITDLITGKLKTWETVNGRKDAVKLVINRSQNALMTFMARHYLGTDTFPDADYVTTVKALAKKISTEPGAISFSGSQFTEDGFTPKFLPTAAKLDYVIIGKKPLSSLMKKTFEALKVD
jgi:hypothetical protein